MSRTFPVNPSLTTTSATPAPRSRPSTLPMNRTGAALMRRNASFSTSLPLASSSPMLRSPTAGSSTPRYTSAITEPMTANWAKCSGLTSRLAPTSSTTVGVPSGKMAAIAGRATPLILPMTKAEAASAAPVDPADTIPTASPSATRPAATITDAPFLDRIAAAGSSAISMTSGAWTTGSRPSNSSRRAPSTASSPTRTTSTPRSAASRAPETVSCGAWSPPIASRAIRAMTEPPPLARNDLPALVRPALRAHAVRKLGRVALRTTRGLGSRHLPRRLPPPGTGTGHLLLGNRHGAPFPRVRSGF